MPRPAALPSNGGELGTFPSATDGATTLVPSQNKVPLCGGVARASVPGWFKSPFTTDGVTDSRPVAV